MIYSTNYVVVNFLPEIKAIEIIWQKPFTPIQEYEMIFKEVINIIKKGGVKNILSDMSIQQAVRAENREFVKKVFVPICYEHGVTHAAFVLSKNIFSELHAKDIANTIDDLGRGIKFFTDKKEAYNWLNLELKTEKV